jgi:hypothetical protein
MTRIFDALNARLIAASPGAAISATSVAWPNRSFAQPTGSVWYRVTWLPGQPRAAAVGTDAQNRHVGLYQVDVFAPGNQGAKTALDAAKIIVAAYKRGTTLTSAGATVYCDNAYMMTGVNEDTGLFHIPVRINYRADIAN